MSHGVAHRDGAAGGNEALGDLLALGIREEYAALLAATGVQSAHDLAGRNVTILTAYVARLCQDSTGSRLGPPSIEIAEWVRKARSRDGSLPHT
jgi:hypothetical protein